MTDPILHRFPLYVRISWRRLRNALRSIMNDRWRSTYDHWKTTPPEMPNVGKGDRGSGPYRCLDCGWPGPDGKRDAVAALAHHRDSRHHRIVNRFGQVQIFSCCRTIAEIRKP